MSPLPVPGRRTPGGAQADVLHDRHGRRHETSDPWQRGRTTLYNNLPDIRRRHPPRRPQAPAVRGPSEANSYNVSEGQAGVRTEG